MKQSRRSAIDKIGQANLEKAAGHPGLWFDRYLEQQLEKDKQETQAAQEKYNNFFKQIGRAQKPKIYKAAYDRWKMTLENMGVRPITARTTYRLAAGHGRESVLETGLTLHHTYGVPIIPGSSLKGAAASYAAANLANWGSDSPAYQILFGSPDKAGFVTFFDALPDADEWDILPDIITVHHREYYQSGDQPPADWDDPTLISFLSVTGTFLIAVHTPDPDGKAWSKAAYEILKMALADEGVGGKTSSGYGRLEFQV